MRSLDPGSSQVVGNVELARLFGRGRAWARRLLETWWAEQQAGGEIRVIATKGFHGNPERVVLRTTRAVLQRYLPQARDPQMTRAIEGLEKDVTFLARRVDRLTGEKEALEKRLGLLEKIVRQTGLARR